MTEYIHAPQINVNEDQMVLVEWTKTAGTRVRRGEVIAVLETSKSTYELQAEAEGFFYPFADAGITVGIGEVIAALAETQEQPAPPALAAPPEAIHVNGEAVPAGGKQWTKKAELLAQRHQLNLDDVARQFGGRTITEDDIRGIIDSGGKAPAAPRIELHDLVDDAYPANHQQRVLVLGGGMGAALVLDVILRTPSQRPVGILDDKPDLQGKAMFGVPVIGKMNDMVALWDAGKFDALVIAISTLIPVREKLYQQAVTNGIPLANVIDPTAVIHQNVALGQGNVILGLVRIGTCSIIGNNNFISAYSNIEHHNRLGDHNTFGPGVMTSGDVTIGSKVKFGTGIFVEPHVQIGSDSIIASGAILTSNVPPESLVKTKANFHIQPRNG